MNGEFLRTGKNIGNKAGQGRHFAGKMNCAFQRDDVLPMLAHGTIVRKNGRLYIVFTKDSLNTGEVISDNKHKKDCQDL